MGGYLSIPTTVRKVLYVEPSVTNVKTEQTGPEVKNGEWVVKDELTKSDNLIDFPTLHESDTFSEAPISESPSSSAQLEQDNTKLKEELQREIESIQQQIDKLTTKTVEEKVVPPPIMIPTEEERIPEFRNQADSSSHAIKKFNRRHRKH